MWANGASQDSLPGDALYPIKLHIERVRLALAPDPCARVALHLTFAERRTIEVENTVREKSDVEGKLLAAMATETRLAVREMAELGTSDQVAVSQQLLAMAERQQKVLALVEGKTNDQTNVRAAVTAS